MFFYTDQRVAVFIDTQNMYYSARNLFGQKVNFPNIIEDAVGDRKLVRATSYVVSTKSGDETPFFDALEREGIEIKSKELMEYLSGVKKADWDVGITVDVISQLDTVDVVVLVSGDGDFVHLARYVQNHGRRFEVASFRETTSSDLVAAADAYLNLSDDKKRFLIGRSRRPPTRMTRGGEALVETDQADAIEEIEEEKAAKKKKTSAKKKASATRKAPAKKPATKKAPAKKTTTRKAPAKKPATKKKDAVKTATKVAKKTAAAGNESSRERRLSF